MVPTMFQIPEWTGHDSNCLPGKDMIPTVFQIPKWTGRNSYCVSGSGVTRP
jgi:hypothetical protein